MLNLNISKDTLEGVLKLSDCEKHHIVKWLCNSQASFYIGDQKQKQEDILNFINGKKLCTIDIDSLKKYLHQVKPIIHKYSSMYQGPTSIIDEELEYFDRPSLESRQIVLDYEQGDRYIRILNTKLNYNVNRALFGAVALENGERLRNSFVGGITNIIIKKSDEGYSIKLELIEKWREVLMEANDTKVKLEKIIEIFNNEIEANVSKGKSKEQAAQIFGIKYAPLINANSEKFTIQNIVSGSNYNDSSILESVKNGALISSEVLWEKDHVSQGDEKAEENGKAEVDVSSDNSNVLINNLYGIHIENTNNVFEENNEHICIGWKGLGDLSIIESKEDLKDLYSNVFPNSTPQSMAMNAGQISKFLLSMKPQDYVVYSTRNEINIGIITGDYYFDDQFDASKKDAEYVNCRRVKWLVKNLDKKGSVSERLCRALKATMSIFSLNNYRKEIFEILEKLSQKELEQYTKEDFLNEVYIMDADYENIKNSLLNKKNLVLQGVPGVGKTFTAKRLAYSIMGVKDKTKIKFVQFHQNYSYEDFIMGFKPTETGFVLENGIFYDFCMRAKDDPNNKYFFIIDEINRGNLSKIFGELLMLIESDKREIESVSLSYNKQIFTVPSNLYIIGMMNTADRSLALIDYALRRRFSFYKMNPAFKNEKFLSYIAEINNTRLNKLIEVIGSINEDIKSSSLGENFVIGHSYFCGLDNTCDNTRLRSIVEYEIIPMLEEYWFDDQEKLEAATKQLKEVFNG